MVNDEDLFSCLFSLLFCLALDVVDINLIIKGTTNGWMMYMERKIDELPAWARRVHEGYYIWENAHAISIICCNQRGMFGACYTGLSAARAS